MPPGRARSKGATPAGSWKEGAPGARPSSSPGARDRPGQARHWRALEGNRRARSISTPPSGAAGPRGRRRDRGPAPCSPRASCAGPFTPRQAGARHAVHGARLDEFAGHRARAIDSEGRAVLSAPYRAATQAWARRSRSSAPRRANRWARCAPIGGAPFPGARHRAGSQARQDQRAARPTEARQGPGGAPRIARARGAGAPREAIMGAPATDRRRACRRWQGAPRPVR